MAAYNKVEVSLNTNAVEVGIPSPQTVNVTIPTVGPAGPTGPQGPQGEPGEVSGSIAWDNVTDKPSTFTPSVHAALHEPTESDELMAQAAVVTTNVADYNGVYFWDWSELVGGRPVFYKVGSRKNYKLEYYVTNTSWRLIINTVVRAESDGDGTARPWGDVSALEYAPAAGSDITEIAVTRAPLEILAQYSAERASGVSTWSELDGKPSTFTPSAHASSHEGDATDPVVLTKYTQIQDAVLDNPSGFKADILYSYGELLDVPATFTPSAHASSHATGGSDAIAPSDIGAQSIFENITVGPISADTTLTASRAARYNILNFSGARTVTLPTTNTQLGDVAIVSAVTTTGNITIQASNGSGGFVTLATITTGGASGEIFRFYVAFESGQQWILDRLQTHTHPASEITSGTLAHERGGLEADVSAYNGLVKISGGATSAVTVTTAGEALLDDADAAAQRTTLGLGTVASSNSYTDLDNKPSIPSTLNDLSNVSAAAPSDNDVLTYDNATSTWVAEAPAAGGVSAIGTSAADILSVSGSDIVADDAGADRIVFWDDSESKLAYLEAGSGLSISGTTMTVTATGGATNLWIPASAWIPKTTAGCGVDSRETATNDQNFDELLFDAGTDEFADALVVMPSNYNNGTITARFYWTAASGSGGVAWAIQGRAFANDDALDTAAGTAQLVTDTLIAADDMHVTSATSAVTIGGTPAANTPIQFSIYRDVSDAADDLAVDARLLGVEIIFN